MNYIIPTPYRPVKNTGFPEENTILLQAAHFKGVNLVPGQIAITFEFCFFQKLIVENHEALAFDDPSVMFTNCFIQQLEIHHITDDKVSVSLGSCIFSGRIAAAKLSSFQVNNCLLRHGLFLSNVPNIRISYTTENIFPYWWNQLFLKLGKGFDWVTADDQNYHIENPVKLVITSSKKEDEKSGYYVVEFNTVRIYRLGYKLSAEQENRIKASVFIKYGGETDEETLIENVTLKALSLSGNPKGNITVERTKISSLYLSEFSPKGDAGFFDLTPRLPSEEETKIGIHKCNLDHVWFDNVDFERFQRLSFYRSKFSSAVFTSCSFPNAYDKFAHFMPIANVHYPDDKTKNYAKDQYEIFLQLKKAMDATGNNYESLKMQAVSQSALRKIKSISLGDKIILGTGSASNDHGQSIGRPFWWFVGISISGYILYLWTLGLIFQPTPFDGNLIGYYFPFIDITHHSDFLVDKKNINGWTLAVDYFIKLLMGYLIFQFIVAFRKYTRK